MRAKDLARSPSGSHFVDRVKKAGVVAPWKAPCVTLRAMRRVMSVRKKIGPRLR